MRALTLKPHWAHAVAWLWKRIENRSRPIPAKLVGERVAIHAGASLPRGWGPELRRACPGGRVVVTHHPDAGPLAWVPRMDPSGCEIRTRAIVATAVLWGEARSDLERWGYFPDWAEDGAHWWGLVSVRRLTTPVPVQRGQLGLWTLDDETATAVEAAAWEAA